MPIHKISIVPTWSFRDQNGRELDPQLFTLLRQIEAQGKLTAAAKTAGISYRHAWNQLNKWADFFGSPLVELEKGRGAKLTPLGDKLLWAEKRVIARLEPQLDNITSELNIDLSRLLSGVRPSLRMHASHGYAVELLPQHVQDFELDLQYKNARDALASRSKSFRSTLEFSRSASRSFLSRDTSVVSLSASMSTTLPLDDAEGCDTSSRRVFRALVRSTEPSDSEQSSRYRFLSASASTGHDIAADANPRDSRPPPLPWSPLVVAAELLG